MKSLDLPGRVILPWASRAPLPEPKCDTALPGGYQCATDCLTLMTCAGAADPIYKQTCVDKDKKKPYCVKGACTDKPDITVAACAAAGFTCTGKGVFPDPSDCTKYHYCSAAAATGVTSECGANLVFNYKTLMCSNKAQTPCATIDCSKTTNAMVLYKPNPAYYAFCLSGPEGQIVMYKCFDEQMEIFDLTQNVCRYNCKSQGNFRDRSNCKGYVTCTLTAGKWVALKQNCPTDMMFKDGACVPQSTPVCVDELPAAAAPGGGGETP